MFNVRKLAYTGVLAAMLAPVVGCGGKPKAPPPEAENAGNAPPAVDLGQPDSGAPKDSEGAPDSPSK